ncbi:MAG: ATP-binding cassette domain-containing protein [Solirubrobacteraceae bacterium]
MPSNAAIVCERLTKDFGHSRGIHDLDMRVEAGEAMGFLGPNGSGKTTTIRALLDLHRPTSGRALLFGLDSHRDSRRIRARLGTLVGEFALDVRLTGGRAVALAAALRGLDDLRPAHELAERFRADLDRPVRELSRGNRQKIGLILALFHRPELLILDEPTSGLDPLMQEEFAAVVREHREAGGAVLLSSHDLDEVQAVCDRVALIRAGRLVTIDSVDAMRDRALREVTLRLERPVDRAALAALPGLSILSTDGPTARLRIAGSPDGLIRLLAAEHVVTLEVTRPSLDELFREHYRDEEPA